MNQFDVIIIGGGPGGLTAGLYSMRAALKTIMFEKGVFGGQMTLTDTIENYPGFVEINGFDLSQKFAEHAQKFGLQTIHKEITAIQPGTDWHKIIIENKETYEAKAIIIATGGKSRALNIPGEKEFYGKGVSYCATCDGFFFRNKTVAVIGGGDTAVEEALYLGKLAEKVYLIHRRDELRASTILQNRVKEDPKIDIIWNHIPIQVNHDADRVSGLTIKHVQSNETQNLTVDGVFIFVGYAPNTELLPKEIEMTPDGYVKVNNTCQTSIPGIYAIGDVRKNYAKQIILAAADGCIAALHAAQYIETL